VTGHPLQHGERCEIDSFEALAARYLAQGGSTNEMIAAIERASQQAVGTRQEALGRTAVPGSLPSISSEAVAKTPAADQVPERTPPLAEALTMVYQPIVALADQTIVGAEALARFRASPEQEPALWFTQPPTVELRVELELAAVRKAMQALPKMPAGTFLTVNVSPDALAADGFHRLIEESAAAARLVAEVTEHAPIHDYNRLSRAIGRLRLLGMRVAVDDVGAGFASLQHILKLAPDFIKLDLTLIRNIQRDRSKQALAAGLISFAERSGATIVAEGIERATEARALTELGARYGQGYYIGRPRPLPLGSRASRRAARTLTQHVAR